MNILFPFWQGLKKTLVDMLDGSHAVQVACSWFGRLDDV